MVLPGSKHDEDGHSSNRTGLIAVNVAFTLLGTSVIIIRFYMRSIVMKSVGKDDYLILVAWLSSIMFAAASTAGIVYGIGQISPIGNKISIPKAIETALFSEIFYGLSCNSVKASVLLFYLKLATSLRGRFYKCTIICLGVLGLQYLSILVVIFLQCRPISFYWNKNQAGKCINLTRFYYIACGLAIASDIVVLLLPIPILLNIKRNWKDTFALICVFGAGTLTIIARLYTIKLFTLSPDPLNDAAPITIWSFIEINIGIACASGPALRAFYKYLTRRTEIESRDSNAHLHRKRSPIQSTVHWWRHMDDREKPLASEGVTRSTCLEQNTLSYNDKMKSGVERIKPGELGPFLTERSGSIF